MIRTRRRQALCGKTAANKGDCLEAMTHYAEVLGGEFGGEFGGVFRNADAPDPENRMPGDGDMAMNMSMKLGTGTVVASRHPREHVYQAAGLPYLDLALVARRVRTRP